MKRILSRSNARQQTKTSSGLIVLASRNARDLRAKQGSNRFFAGGNLFMCQIGAHSRQEGMYQFGTIATIIVI